MSRKGSTVRGDPTKDTESPVQGQDDQGRDEMSASMNSEAGLGVGVQSTSAHQAPVSGQESGHGKKGKSLRTCKQMKTYSLTTCQRELAPNPRKAKVQKAKGVKTSGSDGLRLAWFQVLVRGEESSHYHVIPTTMLKPESVQLPDNLSLRTQMRRVRRAHFRPHPLPKRANLTSLLSRR